MSLRDEIFDEGRRFVLENKGLKLDDKGRQYLSPRISSEFMDCSMPLTFDQYSHCSLGCIYCFAYFFKSCNQTFSSKLHTVNHTALIDTIHGEPNSARNKIMYEHFFKKKFLFHWGGMADPFCNFEKSNGIGYQIVKALAEENYPTLFSFKGSAIFKPNFQNLFGDYSKQKNFAFQVSIIAPTDKQSKEVEIGVPVTSRRIEAIRMLSQMGYYTILRLRPYIIGITNEGIDDLLHKCLEAGIRAVSMEFFAMDARSSVGMRKRYEWLSKLIGVKSLQKYFRALSPSERGGYMRLNRLVKEKYVKTVYKFCQDNNLVFACSDPDFKELNTSGSCCGMPDKYPANPLLENWTRGQMTYMIKEARKKHHMHGTQAKIKFDSVYHPNTDTYLNEVELGQDHVMVSDRTQAQRQGITYLKIAKEIWNNLRSPSNPRNYFHGKVMPITIDGDGNFIYKYIEDEYEEKWKSEGLDLTR